jgi:NAD(P)-dependent dehydrogenase (short-subunit alcohol dehydrogenase family)
MVVGEYTDNLGAAAREIMVRKTPLRRLAEAKDVAAIVRFLVGPNAGFVSGANIPVTGGILFS